MDLYGTDIEFLTQTLQNCLKLCRRKANVNTVARFCTIFSQFFYHYSLYTPICTDSYIHHAVILTAECLAHTPISITLPFLRSLAHTPISITLSLLRYTLRTLPYPSRCHSYSTSTLYTLPELLSATLTVDYTLYTLPCPLCSHFYQWNAGDQHWSQTLQRLDQSPARCALCWSSLPPIVVVV